jgi:hypothetical protein
MTGQDVVMVARSIEIRDPEEAGARAALRDYTAELNQLLGAPSPTITDPVPGSYREPRGRSWSWSTQVERSAVPLCE